VVGAACHGPSSQPTQLRIRGDSAAHRGRIGCVVAVSALSKVNGYNVCVVTSENGCNVLLDDDSDYENDDE
jgi:hypothetical protein